MIFAIFIISMIKALYVLMSREHDDFKITFEVSNCESSYFVCTCVMKCMSSLWIVYINALPRSTIQFAKNENKTINLNSEILLFIINLNKFHLLL